MKFIKQFLSSPSASIRISEFIGQLGNPVEFTYGRVKAKGELAAEEELPFNNIKMLSGQ